MLHYSTYVCICRVYFRFYLNIRHSDIQVYFVKCIMLLLVYMAIAIIRKLRNNNKHLFIIYYDIISSNETIKGGPSDPGSLT